MIHKEFTTQSHAERVSEDSYDVDCEQKGCSTPKAQRVTKFAYRCIKHPDQAGRFILKAASQGEVNKLTEAFERSGWSDYPEAKADEWEPLFVHNNGQALRVTRAEVRIIDSRIRIAGDTPQEAVDFVIAQR